jgi:hypothetical protein
MVAEFHRAVVGVHVEGVLGQARDGRPEELAAEGENEAVVEKDLRSVHRVDARGLSGQVEVGELPFHAANADGAEHVIEGNADRSQVRLVVPHTDAVKGVAVDQGHRDRVRVPAQLVELAGRGDGAPQPGEPASQNQDSFGAHPVSSLTGRTGFEPVARMGRGRGETASSALLFRCTAHRFNLEPVEIDDECSVERHRVVRPHARLPGVLGATS